jgi:hypothetical protein
MVAGLKLTCLERLKACELHSAPDQTAMVKSVGKETVSAPLALTRVHLRGLHQFFFALHGHSLKMSSLHVTDTCERH